MREVTQTILHGDPSGIPGNCLQAAVASLLDLPLDDVPHFIVFNDWLERLAAFCTEHGYRPIMRMPDVTVTYGMAWGPSVRGVRHAVVWVDGEIAWDPHPSRVGLLKVAQLIAFEPVAPQLGTVAPCAPDQDREAGSTPGGAAPYARRPPQEAPCI